MAFFLIKQNFQMNMGNICTERSKKLSLFYIVMSVIEDFVVNL